MNQPAGFNSFADFYPYYLSEHTNTTCRRLHVIGTSLLVMLLIYSIATQRWNLLWLLPIVGYSFAWVGHFVFEKNRPATFQHPVFSLMGDFKMWWQIIRGQLPW